MAKAGTKSRLKPAKKLALWFLNPTLKRGANNEKPAEAGCGIVRNK